VVLSIKHESGRRIFLLSLLRQDLSVMKVALADLI